MTSHLTHRPEECIDANALPFFTNAVNPNLTPRGLSGPWTFASARVPNMGAGRMLLGPNKDKEIKQNRPVVCKANTQWQPFA
ncbi:hypothetical protein GOBAR_AA19822 [Gossypium barbadense]|uniref:Uncharacterized protein n=1 Tax=Gossypium barbadense TaxID=3634 RepID=A0A2P5XBY0_GOSBA|nr:hypothetical protein GOBAR_AA19822 [Gossypium barbadense]